MINLKRITYVTLAFMIVAKTFLLVQKQVDKLLIIIHLNGRCLFMSETNYGENWGQHQKECESVKFQMI